MYMGNKWPVKAKTILKKTTTYSATAGPYDKDMVNSIRNFQMVFKMGWFQDFL